MSETTAPPASSQDNSRPSPGSRLRAARERKGLTIHEAADALRLDHWLVEALERDDYSHFGVPVFVKGHLRAYAALTGEPVDDILLAYHQLVGVHHVTPLQGKPTLVETTTAPSRGISPALVLAAVFVAGAAATWWWYEQPVEGPTPIGGLGRTGALAAASLESDAEADQPIAAPPAADVDNGASGGSTADAPRAPLGGTDVDSTASSSAGSGPDAPAGAATPPATAGSAAEGVDTPTHAAPGGSAGADTATAPVSQATVVAAAPANTAPGTEAIGAAGHVLSLDFREDSWVEIRDASGERLYYGLGMGGARRSVRGQPPFEVFLGRYTDVSVELDGESRPIPQESIRGDTARFSVAP